MQQAQAWCAAWNRRDLEAVLAHYAEDVELRSPFVVQRLGHADGWLRGKAALRDYFALGMAKPTLHFAFVDVLLGVGAVTVLYRRETGALAADTMTLGADGRAIQVVACYGPAEG